ncbi:MAG: GAF domain-containing sensor histidine kinase [Anaerolineales bacterium]|nr:GAF domain-containing sensor histidine kinase [Anaerolineales bacterium]
MPLMQEELQGRFLALHRASLQLVQNISLESLLEQIVDLACEQVGARYAALGVLNEKGELVRFITHGLTAEEIKRIPHPPRGLGLIGALMRGDTGPIRIREIANDPRSVGFPPGHPVMHTMLGVPIRLGNQQLGQIYLTEKLNEQEFTAEDERIIEMLAAYAAVAIYNARLYERLQARERELERRNSELALLNEIGQALNSSLELDEVLNKMLALLMRHFKVEAGEIFLREENSDILQLTLHRGEAAEAFWTRNRFRIGEGMIGRAAATRQPVISSHLERDDPAVRQAVVKAGFQQIVCIPLQARSNLVGVLTIAARKRRALSRDQIQMLVSIGGAAGTAIENARLHYNERRLAILEERERIGMDLHDGIVQSIYAVGLTLENVRHLLRKAPDQAEERLKTAMESLNQIIRDIRSYILDLRPRHMGDESLVAALERLVAEFRQNTGIDVILSCPKSETLADLPPAHAKALFHICQESLANIAKHAAATRVTVDLWQAADRLVLEVGDNGRGFDVEAANRQIGHGLANMQTRAAGVGGEIEISSAPGEGTTIFAWVPRHTVSKSPR